MSEPEKLEISKPKRDPAALSSEYHKAHKQLMLWATILFIWELVGVDLEKAKDTGGNVGPVVTALKSPQAVPWVLLALVLYFLFKCSIEWGQCDIGRRRLRFARADFSAAWFISVAAIGLYIAQAISRRQLADTFSDIWKVLALSAGLFLVMGTVTLSVDLVEKKKLRDMGIPVFCLVIASSFFLIPLVRQGPAHWRMVLVGAAFGVVMMIVLFLLIFMPWRYRRDSPLPKNSSGQ